MDEELKYTFESHTTIKVKNIPWSFCKYCGLIFLNNPATKWCIKMGCNNRYHPQYKQTIKKLTKPK
jgi:hypothetical protein